MHRGPALLLSQAYLDSTPWRAWIPTYLPNLPRSKLERLSLCLFTIRGRTTREYRRSPHKVRNTLPTSCYYVYLLPGGQPRTLVLPVPPRFLTLIQACRSAIGTPTQINDITLRQCSKTAFHSKVATDCRPLRKMPGIRLGPDPWTFRLQQRRNASSGQSDWAAFWNVSPCARTEDSKILLRSIELPDSDADPTFRTSAYRFWIADTNLPTWRLHGFSLMPDHFSFILYLR